MIGKDLTDKDLDKAIKILKSPLGKYALPQMTSEMEKQTIEFIRQKNEEDNGVWTAEAIMSDIKSKPKMLEIYKLVGISESDLKRLVGRALE